MIGKTLDQYEIIDLLGKGGMGEVYRARDTTLDREVAVKVLPPLLVQSADRLARFEREAKLLASLNHPAVAGVYGLHRVGDVHFLAMEFVKGEDLAQRLQRGTPSVDEVLAIAVQVAAGLTAAHEQGVVHRDIKPSNVMLSADGDAKVLDFGLARSADPTSEGELSSLSQSPTINSPAVTLDGMILGTAGYMSPEQARGRAVDRRTDVWAFGVVVFEMLTGRRLFDGETVSDTIASILRAEPDWSLLPADTPARLRILLERCLAKDPRRRLRDMGDVQLELEWIREAPGESGGPSGSSRRGLPRLAWLGFVAAALLGAFAMRVSLDSPPGQLPSHLDLVAPAELEVSNLASSPDGRAVVFVARPREPKRPGDEFWSLYLRTFDAYGVRLLPGTAGVKNVAFSPDGEWLALVAPEEPGATKDFLWKLAVDGSAPALRLYDWQAAWQGLHWLPDDDLVVGTGNRELLRLHADGRSAGSPIPIQADFALESGLAPQPETSASLPDGRHLLCRVEAWGEEGYHQNVVVVDAITGQAKVVLEDGGNARWSDTGHLLFSRGSTLLAVPFDPERLEVTGGPAAVADDLRILASWRDGWFDVSHDGTLVYVPGGNVGGRRRLEWLDSRLQSQGFWSEEGLEIAMGPLVSPDGSALALVIPDADGVYDIWMSETDRPVPQPWLDEVGRDCAAEVWSPDGSHLVYMSRTTSDSRYYLQDVARNEPPVLLFEESLAADVYSCDAFADDGRTLLVTHVGPDGRSIARLDLEGPKPAALPLDVLLDDAVLPVMSPDGEWLLYQSDASGRWEFFVRRWKGGGELGPALRVSTDGGNDSGWWYTPSPGAAAQIWFSNEDKVYSVSIGDGPRPSLSRPEFVGDWDWRFASLQTLPDGRILARSRDESERLSGIVRVVPGWASELRRRVGR